MESGVLEPGGEVLFTEIAEATKAPGSGFPMWVVCLSLPLKPHLGTQLTVCLLESPVDAGNLSSMNCWQQGSTQLWKHKGRISWTWEISPSESDKAETKSGTCPHLLLTWEWQIRPQERGWLFRQFSPCVSTPVSCGTTDSCFKYPLRYIWKRDFYKPHLSCFVITHCATYSNILLLLGEMQFPSEKQSPPANLHWPKVSRPGKAEPADSLNKMTRTCHVGSRRGGEAGLGSDSCFLMLNFSLKVPGKPPLSSPQWPQAVSLLF